MKTPMMVFPSVTGTIKSGVHRKKNTDSHTNSCHPAFQHDKNKISDPISYIFSNQKCLFKGLTRHYGYDISLGEKRRQKKTVHLRNTSHL